MTITNNYELKGIIPAIITPMHEHGGIDFDSLEKQTAYLSTAGASGFFIGGTTGEGAYLKTEEKAEVFDVVRRFANQSQFLCAAYIRPFTADVLDEMKALKKCGPDFVVAVTPFYSSMQQEDILVHFRMIARQSHTPVIIYNIPANTHNPIDLETIQELERWDNIAGVKDSSGDFIHFSRGVLSRELRAFAWIQGEDYLAGPSLMIGGDGIVSGLSNARIEPYIDMYRAAKQKNWNTVLECQSRINRLYAIVRLCGNSVAAVKAATELAGRGSRWLRQKSQSLSDEQIMEVARILDEFDQDLMQTH